MPDGVQFEIKGAAELGKLLESRPPAVAQKIIKRSLVDAVRPWRDEIIARVRRGWHVFANAHLRGRRGQGRISAGREREYGVIANHIVVHAKIDGGGYSGSATVGPVKGVFWDKFLEFGTRKMRAFPFMRPAFETRKQEVLDKFIDDARDELRSGMGLK